MSMITVESLLEQAITLPVADRAELARQLLDSLAPLPEMPQVWDKEADAEAAWQEELQRRVESAANRSAELLDGEQVFAELRARRHGQ